MGFVARYRNRRWGEKEIALGTAITFVGLLHNSPTVATPPTVELVTTVAPFPRGLEMVGGKLYVLCRGRVRHVGGVSAEINDQAGTIYVVDPNVGEQIDEMQISEAIRSNGEVYAVPTEPPFRLWHRSADPPEADRQTDRPYCALRYHEATQSFYICCFSGVDKRQKPGESSFSKNLTDGLLRYDLRTKKWYEVERHNIEAGGTYPHHDPAYFPPPHGWLNGPDNCLPVGNNLYAVSKDNSLLVRYDLSALVEDPEAGHAPSEIVFDENVYLRRSGLRKLYGHSALAVNAGFLYVGFRTSSVIVRLPIDDDGLPQKPIVAELIARFRPYEPQTGESADLTDMTFDSKGRLYVVCARPARILRFVPDPDRIFDARDQSSRAWLDLALVTGNPQMKSENILIDDRDRLFVTSGDAYGLQSGPSGAIYRATIED